MVDTWKSLKLGGISKIERVVAIFEITSEKFPGQCAKFKILEESSGLYIGVPDIAVKDGLGSPDWTSGFGHSIEEALEDTLQSLLYTIEKQQALSEEDFERASPGDFL